MREKVLRYIRELGLMRAGDRAAVAVSGGADSVALWRVLLELRDELGIVLAVAHFNHGLRAAESDADQAFVAELARTSDVEFFAGVGDVRDHAILNKLSLEAAGRELRYQWFARLAVTKRLDVVATAHTLDDQAETVLLKFLRGAGTKGLAGIGPVIAAGAKALPPGRADHGAPGLAPLQSGKTAYRIVRPLLAVSRDEVEAYLESLGQSWREDESNRDHRFLRNRVRHELLPLLEHEYNPNLRQSLSAVAEFSRGDEAYWEDVVARELTRRVPAGDPVEEPTFKPGSRREVSPSFSAGRLLLDGFQQLPMALQRRLLKRFAEDQAIAVDFELLEKLRRCALGEMSRTELPGGRMAVNAKTWLELRSSASTAAVEYEVVLPIPGELQIAELGLTLRATIVPNQFAKELDDGELLSRTLLGAELMVRNWRAGDRFWPAHGGSEEKLKRLFADKHISAEQRPAWPVVLHEGEIVWVRGFPVARAYRWKGDGDAVRIEVVGSAARESS